MKKLIFALAIVSALVVVAMPAMAAGPVVLTTDEGPKAVFMRAAGTNEDPFGGLPIATSSSNGSATKYGVGGPGVFAMPGGKPSTESGDGTSPRRSIYLGGAWDTVTKVDIAAGAKPKELPACALIAIPAGSSRWFKMDTWKNKKLQLWLDDELNGAKEPSGSAVFGAADAYMWGTWAGSVWQKNAYDTPSSNPGTLGNWLEGFAMAVFDPDAMRPNYAYAPPNASLYTLGSGSSYTRSSQGIQAANAGAGVSLTGLVGFNPLEGWAQFNPKQPNHLLWYEARYDGWVHARVYNQMIWDGTATVCSYRAD